jgi:hypothetical protein
VLLLCKSVGNSQEYGSAIAGPSCTKEAGISKFLEQMEQYLELGIMARSIIWPYLYASIGTDYLVHAFLMP